MPQSPTPSQTRGPRAPPEARRGRARARLALRPPSGDRELPESLRRRGTRVCL